MIKRGSSKHSRKVGRQRIKIENLARGKTKNKNETRHGSLNEAVPCRLRGKQRWGRNREEEGEKMNGADVWEGERGERMQHVKEKKTHELGKNS